ncbi:hypothetical protein [Flavobacterium sp. IMCC34518]|uniref:hypothetical protein n=1 Tax=Flavobacterium sp. IMCC34518 TaxID=3003623 RepID=UPI0022ABDF3D|nr:hypothetical protein [Flavobacterium sp. IMCC34518]
MNILNFNQSVGFPLETNILDDMQTSYNIFNALGAIAGNFTIISGCTTVGTTVSNGVVFINGEVLEFKGGLVQPNVIIIENRTALEFEDGNAHDVIYNRRATFGTATTQWPWSDFKRGFETKLIPEALDAKEDKTTIAELILRIEQLEARPASNIPIGLIAVWGQPVADIPDGWVEYTPLKGRMPVGLDTSIPLFDTLLDYGGDSSKTLSINELPKFRLKLASKIPSNVNDIDRGSGSSNFSLDNAVEAYTEYIGGDQAFDIMNPYRVVHFIQYLG